MKKTLAAAAVTLCLGAASPTAPQGWKAETRCPLGARTNSVVVWNGRELLIVGGDGRGGRKLSDGAAFNPHTGRWRKLPAAPEPVDGSDGAVWTGTKLVVADATTIAFGGTWTTLPASPITGVSGVSLVLDRTGAVVEAGGDLTPRPVNPGGGFYLGDTASRAVARYSFTSNAWTLLSPIPTIAGHPVFAAKATDVGGKVLVQDGWERITPTKDGFGLSGGGDDFYLDADGSYRTAGSTNYASVARVGGKTVIADGLTCLPFESCPARFTTTIAVLDATGKLERGISPPPIPQTLGVSTGKTYVVVTDDGITGGPLTVSPGDAAVLDVQTKKWAPLPSAKKLVHDPESLVWTGRFLLLYGEGRLARLG